MKQALSAWISQEEERERLTQEALADVDAGLVIEHQTVQAWADSLSTDQPLQVPAALAHTRRPLTGEIAAQPKRRHVFR